MKRILLLISAVSLALALAPAASARVVEVGAVPNSAVKPSCPADPCEAAVRVTAIQGPGGGRKNPYYIRRDGYIVAFTVQLSKPSDEQMASSTTTSARRRRCGSRWCAAGDTRKTRLNYRLVSQTDLFDVDRYLGSTPTFVIDPPLRVKKTNWIAITVPTWAPMFANNLTSSDWWRSSRAKGNCEPPDSLEQFALQVLRKVSVFGCTYHGARLLYSATYIPDPHPTVKTDKDEPN